MYGCYLLHVFPTQETGLDWIVAADILVFPRSFSFAVFVTTSKSSMLCTWLDWLL